MLVERVVGGGQLGIPFRQNGRTLTVVPVSASQERVAMQLYVQAGLEQPKGLPDTIWVRAYPANLAEATRLLANSPPLNGAFFLLNNQIVNRQTASVWLPPTDHGVALADPRDQLHHIYPESTGNVRDHRIGVMQLTVFPAGC